jgi:hypothetical protein
MQPRHIHFYHAYHVARQFRCFAHDSTKSEGTAYPY